MSQAPDSGRRSSEPNLKKATEMSDDRMWHTKSGSKRQSASQRANNQKKEDLQNAGKGGAGRAQNTGSGKERASAGAYQAGGDPLNTFTNQNNASSVPERQNSVNEYNAAEVEAAMKAPVEPAPMVYKPTNPPAGQSANRKDDRTPPAPWATSAPSAPKEPSCIMANGKDFWVELRRQYEEHTRNGGGPAQGG